MRQILTVEELVVLLENFAEMGSNARVVLIVQVIYA
jgi:hypothetical protein